MHSAMLKHLRKQHPEEECIGGITTGSVNIFIVGTPCVAQIKPFTKHDSKQMENGYVPSWKNYKSQFLKIDPYPGDRSAKKKPKKKPSQGVAGGTKAIELYDMDLKEANNVLKCSLNQVKAVFLYNMGIGNAPTYSTNIKTSAFYFDGSKPLIHDDNYLRIEAENIKDILSQKEMESIGDITLENLKNYRYVNYTINGLLRSNVDGFIGTLLGMRESVGRELKYSTCFYMAGKSPSYIIDTASISFYRLQDVISVFDPDMATGMCMEIFLYSSASKEGVAFNGSYMAWRFLFCKYRDNAFTIDGEEIQRPADVPTTDALRNACDNLTHNVGNDKAIRKKEKTASK